MPTHYVTLKKSDTNFFEYLWGANPNGEHNALPKTQRAIPVKTYNLGTPEESVTFELKNITDTKKPSFFVFASSLIKLNSFVLILLPLLYILTKNFITKNLTDPLAILLAALSAVLLFAGFNIRNDVNDHTSGFDRVNLGTSCKPIQMGWISAHKAARLSLILILISGVLALPVVFLHPQLLWIIVFSFVLFFIGRFTKNNSYKQQHLGEFILFILAGPALVLGYQVAMGAGLDVQAVSFGTLWGFGVLFLIQINNFSHIMTSSQAGIKNTMTQLGFDRAQKFLVLSWVLFLIFWILFHYYFANIYWLIFGSLLLVFCSVPFFKKILNIKSPMGSDLPHIRNKAHKTFLLMGCLFIAEIFWSLGLLLWTNAH